MITLRIPNRTDVRADLQGRRAFCQNLNCRARLEPPYQKAHFTVPGGTLETLLCAGCMPQPGDGIFPEMRLELVEPATAPADGDPPGPEQSSHGMLVIALSQLSPSLPPPAASVPTRAEDRRPTFAELAHLEPRLLDLVVEALAHHENREPVFCANAVWYGYPGCWPSFKHRLLPLVGFEAEKEGILRTAQAYDVAYQTIYRALPDCRGRCRCSG